MQTITKRIQSNYTLAFKLAVVEQIEKAEITYKQCTKTICDFLTATFA
ncbi:MAG: transposase [Glaciecola sp.]|jgi:transposase